MRQPHVAFIPQTSQHPILRPTALRFLILNKSQLSIGVVSKGFLGRLWLVAPPPEEPISGWQCSGSSLLTWSSAAISFIFFCFCRCGLLVMTFTIITTIIMMWHITGEDHDDRVGQHSVEMEQRVVRVGVGVGVGWWLHLSLYLLLLLFLLLLAWNHVRNLRQISLSLLSNWSNGKING